GASGAKHCRVTSPTMHQRKCRQRMGSCRGITAKPSSMRNITSSCMRKRSATATIRARERRLVDTIDAILGKEGYMAESTLTQVQCLVDQLSLHEQAHLLAFLALRMAQAVTSLPASSTSPEPGEAWQEFFRLGAALAASDNPTAETLTAALLAMRR